MGKGSKRRPTNEDAYRSNWDNIFGKKPLRQKIDERMDKLQEMMEKDYEASFPGFEK